MKPVYCLWLLSLVGDLMAVELDDNPVLIAHAGGGYLGQKYTNSLEALDASYQAGFRHMEIDFSWTADGHLVCLHDWKKTFKKLFKTRIKSPLTLNQFESYVAAHPDFRSCTLDTLAAWALAHPGVKIITDIKHDNLKGIALILDRHPQLAKQLVAQFYQPEEYAALKQMGLSELIWILYQYKGTRASVVEWAQNMNLVAVSMRASQAKKSTYQRLLESNGIFVYTINRERVKDRLTCDYGVSGIYTDFLPVPGSSNAAKACDL